MFVGVFLKETFPSQGSRSKQKVSYSKEICVNRLGSISSSFFTSHMRPRYKTAPADMLDAFFWTGLAGKLTFL